jgi:hypothetical protein
MFNKLKHSKKGSFDSKTPTKDGFFGHPLGDKVVPKVRAFLDDCIDFLLKRGSEEPGIFRICGSDLQVREMKKLADKGKLKLKENFDVHNVASLFKMYFREMHEPLLTFDLYEQFIAAHLSPPAQRAAEIASVIQKLPSYNKEIFAKVSFFLSNLARHKQKNLMDERNLAIVFSPAFLRARVETPEIIIGDAPHTTGLIATVIDGVEFFLGIKTPRTIEGQPKSVPLSESVCKDRMLRHRQKSMATIQVMRSKLRDEQKIDDGVINKQLEELSKKIKEGDFHSIDIEKDEPSESVPTPSEPAPVLSAKSQGRFLQRRVSFQVGVNVTKMPSKPVLEVPVESKPVEQVHSGSPTKVRRDSDSLDDSSDSDVFDDSIFAKFEQSSEDLTADDKEGWNLLQLIYSKIQNPNVKPSNPEEDLQVRMLNLLLLDDSTVNM